MNPDASPRNDHGLLPLLAERLGRRELTARRSLGIIIGSTATVTLAGGILMRLLDGKDFSSFGEGMWWAVQTVTTVGYGDVVPHNAGGRVIATVVMLTGIAFISLITASVTATLVQQRRQPPAAGEDRVASTLEEIRSRLDAIEHRLDERG
jgi:voltage-gated potassium channel